MIFFTADTHFGHENILKYLNRPFDTVEEMDEHLIYQWNAVVKAKDTIYHLGDLSWRSPGETMDILHRLNGKIHLIAGNHDKAIVKHLSNCFESVSVLKEIKYQKQKITLCHYAMKIWRAAQQGAWHLYGHYHGVMPEDYYSFSRDIGVDNCKDFAPLSFERIKELMSRKEFVVLGGVQSISRKD